MSSELLSSSTYLENSLAVPVVSWSWHAMDATAFCLLNLSLILINCTMAANYWYSSIEKHLSSYPHCQDLVSTLLPLQFETTEILIHHGTKTSDGDVHIAFQTQNTNSVLHVVIPSITSAKTLLQYSRVLSNDTAHRRNAMFFICWPGRESINNLNNSFSQVQHLRLDEHVYVVMPQATHNASVAPSTSYSLFEVYSILNRTFMNRIKTARSDGYQFSLTTLINLAVRRADFRQTPLRLVGQHDDRHIASHDVRVENGKVSFAGGAHVDIAKDLAQILNFRIDPIAGEGWVGTLENSTEKRLTGMGRQIMEDEGDLSIAKNTMFSYRVEQLHFLPPVAKSPSAAFYREPRGGGRNIMVMPFNTCVWVLSTITATTIVFMYIFFQHFPKGSSEGQEDDWFAIIAVVCFQGCDFPKRFTLRLTCFTALATCFVMFTFYTGSFVATVTTPLPIINKFQDFLKYNFEVFTNPDLPQYAQEFVNDNTTLEAIYASSKRLFKNYVESVRQILSPKRRYAYIINDNSLLRLAIESNVSKEDVCEISVLKNKLQAPLKDGMFLKRGSPLKEMFSYGTIFLLERGMVKIHFSRSYTGEARMCTKLEKKQIGSLEFQHCILAFEIISIGFILSVVVTILETCCYCRKYSQKTFHYFE